MLRDAVMHLQLEETSFYQPSSQDSDSQAGSSSDLSDGTQAGSDSKVSRRAKLNEFLLSCNAPRVGPCKKRWAEASARTKSGHIAKAKALVVAGLEVIAPGDAGHHGRHLEIQVPLRKNLGLLRSHLKNRNTSML